MQDANLDKLDKETVVKAYARWAPVYDVVFGPVFERGRKIAITAAERIGGRMDGGRDSGHEWNLEG